MLCKNLEGHLLTGGCYQPTGHACHVINIQTSSTLDCMGKIHIRKHTQKHSGNKALMQSFWLYLPPIHDHCLKRPFKSECQNLLFCVLRRKPSCSQYFTMAFVLFFFPITVSIHLCVICRHFFCPMSLFQGYVPCENFTLTGSP